MSTALISIDFRESAIIPHMENNDIKSENIAYEVKKLDIGDYMIYVNGILIAIIERKTWNDLHASMNDGRKENVEKLLFGRQQSSCIIIYLIEHERIEPAAKKRLQAHLDHLIVRHGIHVMYTEDKKSTAKRLYEFTRNSTTVKNLNEIFNCAGVEKLEKTMDDRVKKMWLCFSGIGPTIAGECARATSIKDLFIIGTGQLDGVKYPGGRNLAAAKIAGQLDSENLHIKLLSSIDGVSETMAREILEQISFLDICKTLKIDNIIRKNGKKIGAKLSEKIINHLVHRV